MKPDIKTLLTKVALFFLAGTFVIFGVANFFMGPKSPVVARIGKDKIYLDTLARAVNERRNNLIARGEIGPDDLAFINSQAFVAEMLKGMVQNKLLTKEINALGIAKPQSSVMGELARTKSFLGLDGKFDTDTYEEFLRQAGMTEQQFISSAVEFQTRNEYFYLLTAGRLSNQEAQKTLANLQNKVVTADVITIDTSKMNIPTAAVSDEEAREFYGSNPELFIRPEIRIISYIDIDFTPIISDIVVADEEVRQAYDGEKYKIGDFEDRKESLRAELIGRKIEIRQAEIVSNLEDATLESEDIGEIGRMFGVSPETVTYIPGDGGTIGGIDRPEFLDEYEAGDFSEVIYMGINGCRVYHMDDVEPSRQMDWEESKDLAGNMVMEKNRELAILDEVSKIRSELNGSNTAPIVDKYRLQLLRNITIPYNSEDYSESFVRGLYGSDESNPVGKAVLESEGIFKISLFRSSRPISENDEGFITPEEAGNILDDSIRQSIVDLNLEYLFKKGKIKIDNKVFGMLL